MDTKTIYVSPRLIAYEPQNLPERLRFRHAPKPGHVTPAYTTVVDNSRSYVDVSDSFCDLVGYSRDELIGTRYDHLTALNTADIPVTYELFTNIGYMNGLWVLLHRTGYRILVRYECWIRPDFLFESNIEVVDRLH
jgi:PAS domain-containing protein